jgi:hypothetical protein
VRHLAAGEVLPHHGQVMLCGLFRARAAAEALLQDAAQCGAGHDVVRRQAVHLGEALVGDHEPLVGIEHGKTLEHVAQRRVEQHVLPPEPGICPAEIAKRAAQHPERQDREYEIGGKADAQRDERNHARFFEKRPQARDDHSPPNLRAVNQDRGAAKVGRRCRRGALLQDD